MIATIVRSYIYPPSEWSRIIQVVLRNLNEYYGLALASTRDGRFLCCVVDRQGRQIVLASRSNNQITIVLPLAPLLHHFVSSYWNQVFRDTQKKKKMWDWLTAVYWRAADSLRVVHTYWCNICCLSCLQFPESNVINQWKQTWSARSNTQKVPLGGKESTGRTWKIVSQVSAVHRDRLAVRQDSDVIPIDFRVTEGWPAVSWKKKERRQRKEAVSCSHPSIISNILSTATLSLPFDSIKKSSMVRPIGAVKRSLPELES